MDPVKYSLEGTAAVVQMDDGKANALSVEMIDALLAALDRAEKEASAVVLAGRPERFCAGFDLRVMMSGPDAAKALLARGGEMLLRYYGSSVPVVVASTGHALAGGALLLLTGDARIGAAGPFKIGLNEVAIGLPVPLLAMSFARDNLLPTELTRATLHANVYAPDDARAAGWLHRVVPPDELLDAAKQEAARLGALGRQPYVATKERLRGPTIRHIRDGAEADMKNLMTPR